MNSHQHAPQLNVAKSSYSAVTYAASEEIPVEALTELASHIVSLEECLDVARSLDFDQSYILRWSRRTEPFNTTAEEILLLWNERTAGTNGGTRSALAKALQDAGRCDLYDIFIGICRQILARAKEPLRDGTCICMYVFCAH